MKYQLETIPVWDAFNEQSECPLCFLEDRNEKTYIKFFLGDSVMDPDTRVEVNKTGFCAQHSQLLFLGGHKQGLGLMMHTFLQHTIPLFENRADKLLKSTKGKPSADAIKQLSDFADTSVSECIFCRRLEQTLLRYCFTIIYLWKKDEQFKEAFKASKGFCLKHLPIVLDMAAQKLSGSGLRTFLNTLLPLQTASLHRLEKEILWFTQKFEYRNKDKPWNSSKDALQRILQKLTGKICRE
jgi:hypothetical protein